MSILESPQRIAVVSRKFWPHVDDGSQRLMCMLDGWRSRGIESLVITVRWHASWPDEAVLRDTRVVRLLPAPKSNWNENQFQKNVLVWLGRNLDRFDAIYVDSADGLLSSIAAKASRWNKPVIARFSVEADEIGLPPMHAASTQIAADACRRCQRVVVPNAMSHRILISHGIDTNRIERIADWARPRVERTSAARTAAGNVLFQVSSDFVIPSRTQLVLHLGESDLQSLLVVVRALCDVLDQDVDARMWIVGSQTSHALLYEAAMDRGWHREILFFDGFDDIEELVAVADLAIVSKPSKAMQFSASMILHSDLPMIAAETEESKSWFAEQQPMKLYADQQQLVERLMDWQVHGQQWITQAIALRVQMQRDRSSHHSLDLWEQLLKPLSIESRG